MSFDHDIDIIYKNYIDIDVKQIDKYMLTIFEKYHINSIDYVMNMICEYAENLEKEEYRKYREKQKKIRAYHGEIIRLMDEYLKTNSPHVIFELLKYNDVDSLNSYLQTYLDIKPKRKLEIEYLKDQLNETNQKLNKFDMYKKYLESNQPDQNIVNLITLLFCEDENMAITLLDKYHFSEKEYNCFLNKFEDLFPTKKHNLKYLKSIYDKYASSHDEKLDDPIIKKNIELIEDMIVSDYSVLEYLSYNGGYTIGEINKIFSEIRNLNIPKYKKMLTILNTRSDESLFKCLDDLVLKIHHQEKFELMDYYNYTKLNIEYFRQYVLNQVEDSEIKKDVLHKLNLIWDFSRVHFEIRENSISGVSIIKGVTVGIEEKQKIYTYLKENGIPLVDATFNYYVRKYANGELDLEKHLELKKKIGTIN